MVTERFQESSARHEGFTLVELLVVVVIVALLIALAGSECRARGRAKVYVLQQPAANWPGAEQL